LNHADDERRAEHANGVVRDEGAEQPCAPDDEAEELTARLRRDDKTGLEVIEEPVDGEERAHAHDPEEQQQGRAIDGAGRLRGREHAEQNAQDRAKERTRWAIEAQPRQPP
jgi:hypothetical protein